jgi:hypothetical protein
VNVPLEKQSLNCNYAFALTIGMDGDRNDDKPMDGIDLYLRDS